MPLLARMLPTCTSVFRCVGSFIILVDLFLFQTGFVFANQASGVKEEYLFFHNKSYLNSIECDPTADGCQPFNLPKWVDCSDEASALRDKYKKFFEVRTTFDDP